MGLSYDREELLYGFFCVLFFIIFLTLYVEKQSSYRLKLHARILYVFQNISGYFSPIIQAESNVCFPTMVGPTFCELLLPTD